MAEAAQKVQEFPPLTIDGTLNPHYIRSILNEARALGPGRPARIAQSIKDRMVDDPEEYVGLGVEHIEEEVIPELRDTVFGGVGDERYNAFVAKYLTPLGIDGRTSDAPRKGNRQFKQIGLF